MSDRVTTRLPDEPYYYQDAAPTERLHAQPGAIVASLAAHLDQSIPARPVPLIVALVVIVAGAVKLGWELRGVWGPIVDNRGWAALLVFAVIGSAMLVNRQNRH